MAAFLEHVGGRQIDRDAPAGQRQAERAQGRAHALAQFRHRLVRQPHEGEGRQAARHLHLDVDVEHVDALEGDRAHPRDHSGNPPSLQPARL